MCCSKSILVWELRRGLWHSSSGYLRHLGTGIALPLWTSSCFLYLLAELSLTLLQWKKSVSRAVLPLLQCNYGKPQICSYLLSQLALTETAQSLQGSSSSALLQMLILLQWFCWLFSPKPWHCVLFMCRSGSAGGHVVVRQQSGSGLLWPFHPCQHQVLTHSM